MVEGHPSVDALLDPVRVRMEYPTEAAFITDVAGHLTWVAPSVADLLGRSTEDLMGLRVRDLVDPVDRDRANGLRAELMSLGPQDPAITTEPLRFRTGLGRIVWCAVTARLVFDRSDVIVGITGALRDVDEIVQSREEAARANLNVHEALDAQQDPWITAVAIRDSTGSVVDFRYEDVNRAAAAFHGRSVDELAGHTLRDTYGGDSVDADISAGATVLATGEPLVLNDQWSEVSQRHGRPPTWLDIRISPVGHDRILYTWRDVTERYRAVARQAEAFHLLRAVMDAQIEPHAILRAVRDERGVAVDFVYEDCNDAAAAFEGRRRDELVGGSLIEVTPSRSDAEVDIADCARVLSTGRPQIQNDVVTGYLRPDGRPIVIDGRIVPIDGERVSYAWRDVTDRYDDQRRLLESEERFRLLAGASSDVVYLAGLDGRITWVAGTIARSLGWLPSDWIGHLPGDFIHPDDLERAGEPSDSDPGAGATEAEAARRIRAADGTYRWMIVHREALFDSGHRLIGVSGSLKDVDQIVRARNDIAVAHDTLRAVLDNEVDPHVLAVAVRDTSGSIVDFRYVDCNAAAASFEGRTRQSMIGRTFSEVYASYDEAVEDIDNCRHVVETGEPLLLNDDTTDSVDAQGRRIMVDLRIVSIGDDRVSYQWRDVTDRYQSQQRLAQSEERFRLLAEKMSDIVVLITNHMVEWVSPSSNRVLGWPEGKFVGQDPRAFVHPDDLPAIGAWMQVDSGPLPRTRFRMRDNEGQWRWMEVSGSVVTTPEERRVVIGGRIVDAEVAALGELERMAHHDHLTGLVNRHAVFEQLGRVIDGQSRSGTEMGVMFFDLDGFKEVNDDAGHAVGDLVLRTVAERVLQVVRGDDVVARIGGDEFLVVLKGLRGVEDALSVAHKVRKAVRQPIGIPGGFVRVSASIGVAMAEPGQSVDDLVAEADRAMYEAKRQGKDAVAVAGEGFVG
ncbi:MAG: PAS domain S-box protein [Actinomycetales bacterium]|nr:PAS domain S-box protein [Actinomycetales bacterium]